MITLLIILGIVYITGAIIMYGVSFAYWRNHYPELAEAKKKVDRASSIIFGMLWFAAIFDSEYRGILIKSFKKNGMKFK